MNPVLSVWLARPRRTRSRRAAPQNRAARCAEWEARQCRRKPTADSPLAKEAAFPAVLRKPNALYLRKHIVRHGHHRRSHASALPRPLSLEEAVQILRDEPPASVIRYGRGRSVSAGPVTRRPMMEARMIDSLRYAQSVAAYIVHHPANQGHRVRAIARAVRFQLRSRLGLSTRASIGVSGTILVDRGYRAASKVIYANPPDWNEMLAWRNILNTGAVFIDVGANVGTYSIWAAECGAAVIAIEPDPPTSSQLRRNVRMNDASIDVRQIALADRSGRSLLTSGLDAGNHLAVDGHSDATPVAVSTLDDIIGKSSGVFVKIDVEGAERLVLDGGRSALTDGRIVAIQLEWNALSEILFSYSRRDISALLNGYGYELMTATPTGRLVPYEERSGPQDVFAIKVGRLSSLVDRSA